MPDNDDFDGSMYDVDDFEPPVKQANNLQMLAMPKGSLIELDIGGKRVEVVSPQYIKDSQALIQTLANRLRELDNAVRQLDQKTNRQLQTIADLQTQLNRKIDRG
jgi:hypothetical protein